MPHDMDIVPNPERPVDLAAGGADAALLPLPHILNSPSAGGVLTPPELKDLSDRKSPSKSVAIQPVPELTAWQKRFPHGVDVGVAIWMALMHIGTVAAFFYFTWPAFATFLILHFVTACLGITLGFHRMLTHSSFATTAPVRYFFSMCGMLSAEGSPLMWVANHRKHHALSDEEGDPHTPNDGFWWCHMFWFMPNQTREEVTAHLKRWAPDLYKDPGQRFMHHLFPFFSPLVGLALYGIGEYFFKQGIPFVLWGLCARMAVCYHCTWFVNSATHIWGYRNYHTSDRSRNLWWVALLSYGEGWHNNHHAHQRLARHGHRWFEIDATYAVIWTLQKLGLVWNVQNRLPGIDKSAH